MFIFKYKKKYANIYLISPIFHHYNFFLKSFVENSKKMLNKLFI